MQVWVKQHYGTCEREHRSRWREGVRITLLETRGEALQDSLALLSLTGQNHLLQKWPKNQEEPKNTWAISWRRCITSLCAQIYWKREAYRSACSRLCLVKSKNFRYSSPTARLKSLLSKEKRNENICWKHNSCSTHRQCQVKTYSLSRCLTTSVRWKPSNL